MAQARDRLLRRQAVPLADALASPSTEVDWRCEGQAEVEANGCGAWCWERSEPQGVRKTP